MTAVETKKTPKRESGETDAQAELASAIDELLETVGNKFQQMSKDILGQMDAMAKRLDELEAQAKISSDSDKASTQG